MPITRTRRGRSPEPYACRIDLPSAITLRPPGSRSGQAPQKRNEEAILCAACGAEITHQRQAIVINTRHTHAFFNPAGIAFEIRCFRLAPGATSLGAPSAEFTWFPGYRWQIAICAACQAHLGWLFTNGVSFFGLIAPHLR